MDRLLIEDISKSFDGTKVLSHFSAELSLPGRYALMGKSGIGKTTLLRILLGLEAPDEGRLSLVPKTDAPLRFSVLFQEDRLFPGADAVKNICAATRSLKKEEAQEALSLIAPDVDIHIPCRALSGGQKRRVSLIRALLHPSDVLLLDEPFTGLDEATRKKAIEYTRAHIGERLMVMTTHDENDAAALGCKMLRLEDITENE